MANTPIPNLDAFFGQVSSTASSTISTATGAISSVTGTIGSVMNTANSFGAMFGGGSSGSSTSSAAGSTGTTTALDVGTDYQENILNNFQQVAYHFRLYTTASPDGTGPAIIIAESGVTGYNINDVEITSLVEPNSATRACNATGFTIVVSETMGTSFLDAMFMAAVTNKIKNYTKYIYFLELTFKGYDNTGVPVTNLLENTSTGGRWVFPIAITNMDVQVDASGGTYTMSAIPYAETVYGEVPHVTDFMSIKAETIGDFFQTLGSEMTKASLRNYGSDVYTFNFVVHDGDYGDANKFKLLPAEKDLSNAQILWVEEADTNFITAQINRGTQVADIVDTVFANCEEAQVLARNGTGTDKTSLSPGDNRERIIFRVTTDAEIGDFDPKTNNYKKIVTYHINSYVTQKPLLAVSESNFPPQVQMDALKKRGGLYKKYDFIYTGLNTEVLQFDMRYNFPWSAQLPRLDGLRYGNDSTQMFARFNENVHAEPNTYDSRISAVGAAVGMATGQVIPNAAKVIAAGISGQIAETKNSWDSLTTSVTTLGGLLPAAGKEISDGYNSTLDGISTVKDGTYAEDLTGDAAALPLPPAITQSAEASRAATGSGMTSGWDRGKSIYGIVLDQLYGVMASNQMQINLEIRGDPYWFGPSGAEPILNNPPQSTAERPDWRGSQHGFVLCIRYPYGVGPDGAPIMRLQDVFSGVYMVTRVLSKFSAGEFKQTLSAYRYQFITVQDADASKGGATPAKSTWDKGN